MVAEFSLYVSYYLQGAASGKNISFSAPSESQDTALRSCEGNSSHYYLKRCGPTLPPSALSTIQIAHITIPINNDYLELSLSL